MFPLDSYYGGPVKKNFLGLAFFCSLLLAGRGWTQTFDLNGNSQDRNKKSQQKQQGNKKQASGRPSGGGGGGSAPCGTSGSGWGGSIEAGRYARAAETAL
ncbi:MAG TPA: hypothetical protein VE133_02035, partial [Candidatus Sulfotelmatobacter sp.]|nr:hypothetical protein [Candidatus Sulfotelmatobacter sp.]